MCLGILLSVSLTLYTKAIEYYVVTPYTFSHYIITEGHLPQKFSNLDNLWNNHVKNFVYYPGTAIIISFISIISNIDAYLIVYTPINAIIFNIVLFLFLRNIYFFDKKPKFVHLIFLLLPIYIIARYPFTWNLTYHSLGFVPHLLILYYIVKSFYLHEKKRSVSLIIILLFLLSLFSYYTTTMYTIVFIFAIIIWSILIRDSNLVNIVKQLKYLLIILSISYLSYDIIVWSTLNSWKLDFNMLIHYLLTFVQRYISGLPPSEELYPLGTPFKRDFLDILLSRIISSFSFFSPLLILFLIYFNNIQFQKDEKSKHIVLILSSVTVAIFEMLSYVIAGMGLNFRYLYIFTPLITLGILSLICERGRSYKRVLCLLLLFHFAIATVATIKLYTYNNVIEGLGTWKKSLVRLPDYGFFVKYSCCNATLYSNFQVSSELRMLAVKMNKANEIVITPFLSYTFVLYNISNYGTENIDLNLPNRSIIIITIVDLTKPVYGSAWGYATPPFGEQLVNMLDKKEKLLKFYSSDNIYAFYLYKYLHNN